jgi:hypothetical protein
MHTMPDLTPSQVARITAVASVLAEVAPVPLHKWVGEFATEADPEQAIRIWERYTKVFDQHTQPTDTAKRKVEVLKVCLSFTRFLPSLIKDERFETLSTQEVDDICADLIG